MIGCATGYWIVAGAGPGPILGTRSQACGDGIHFNVGADPVELLGRANPVIEGFVLPEMLALAAENGIDVAGGDALQAVHDSRNQCFRRDQQVDVIWHHSKSMEIIEIQCACTFVDSVDDGQCDLWIVQSQRAGCGLIQDCV